MFRRFSPFQLIWSLVVIVLWSAVLCDKEARQVARQQWHNSLVPYSRDISYESLDENRVDDRILRASLDNKHARSLLDRFPDDAALLAAYMRQNNALLNFHWDGPLLSGFVAWSVQVTPPSPLPPNLEGMPNFPKPQETKEILRLVARGQKLEPQNTFWDWMEMAALLAGGREREMPRVLNRAVGKREWNDHIDAEMRAFTSWNERNESLFVPAAKTFGYSATRLPHLSIVRNVTNSLAQQVMGLRLQGRDDAALQLGLQTMRLARVMRLGANTPLTSAVGASCEGIILREARVPLGQLTRLPVPAPSSVLAKAPESLLFLARRRSPIATREIGTEWTRLNGWKMNSIPDLFGGLVARSSMERVAWTTRAASYGITALPMVLVVWLGLSLVSWRWNIIAVPPSRWESIAGLLLLVGFCAFDWVTRAIALRANSPGSFCDVNCIAPEEVLSPVGSFLESHSLIWSSVTLWLGMFAFRAAFITHKTVTTPEQGDAQSQERHPIDILWNGLKWAWRGQGRMWSLSAPLWILALSLAPVLVLDSSLKANNPVLAVLTLALSLCVWSLAVGIRQMMIFLRTRQRTMAPARFIASWKSALSGFVIMALVALPVFIWAQSRYERDFNREFAPIEQGQMVAAIQKMRGVPMR